MNAFHSLLPSLLPCLFGSFSSDIHLVKLHQRLWETHFLGYLAARSVCAAIQKTRLRSDAIKFSVFPDVTWAECCIIERLH